MADTQSTETVYIQSTTGKLHQSERCGVTRRTRYGPAPIELTTEVRRAIAAGAYNWCQRCAAGRSSSEPEAVAEIPAEADATWPVGKTFGDLTPAQRTAAVKHAAGQLQDELQASADAIGKVMDEAEIPAKAELAWMRTRGDGVSYHRTDNGQNARCRRELVAYGAVLTDDEMDEMVATVAHTHRCANCQADQAIELAAEGGSGFAPGQPYYEIYPASGPDAFSTKRNPTCVNQGTAEHNARECSRDGRAYVVELVDAEGKRSQVAEFRNGRKVGRA